MINRNNRFHGRSALQHHYPKSKSVRVSTMALRFCVNNRRSEYRLAVVVSKKVSKSAVVRNRIRRRLYENVRILYGSQSQAFDLVLIAYDDKLARMPADELRTEVIKLYQKADLNLTVAAEHAMMEPKE